MSDNMTRRLLPGLYAIAHNATDQRAMFVSALNEDTF
jgi:hypothetical protein